MRTFDAEYVNAIANDADVRAMMGVDQLDFTHAVADRRNVFLAVEGFCAMFIWSAPGVYECHVMARAGYRGRFMLDASRAMLLWMRDAGARMVWGQPSVNNRAAIWFIRRMGLLPAGFGDNPIVGAVQYFVLEDLRCRQL